MLFNSFEFLLFFPTVIMLYYALPHKYRWILLLLASYFFYASWKAEYLLLIIISTLVDYFCAGRMAAIESKRRRKPFLYISLLTNLGILFGFKYFNFFRDNVNPLLEKVSMFGALPELEVLLPVGISFYTFQTLSYTIDVYNGKLKPEKHLGLFAVYVSFFPQLVAGPIERAPRLLPQFRQKFDFDYVRVRNGLMLMLWGFFKKMVIADRVAEFVNVIYGEPEAYSGLTNLVGTYFFAFQIYCDFSGYSDIAIGSAMIMGYSLMTNFKRPYFATSVRDHWQRWHISLSTWFRDYVYIPLGGNRTVKWRWWYNLLVTFLVSGLWHGANWTFVVWGGIHGFLLVLGLWTDGFRKLIYKVTGLSKAPKLLMAIQIFIVFHLVIVAWVFFRAESIQDALVVLKNIAGMRPGDVSDLMRTFTKLGIMEVGVALAAIAGMEVFHVIQERGISFRHWVGSWPMPLRWAFYVTGIVVVVLFGKFSAQTDFIYFQF